MKFLSFWNNKQTKLTILDSQNSDHIEKVADEIVFNGGVVAFPVVYSYGLMTASTSIEGMKKIFMIKKRPLTDTLVIGASKQTRDQIIDWTRVPAEMLKLGDQIFDLPHFLEMPIQQNIHQLVGKSNSDLGRVGIVFWANFYEPIAKLEEAVRKRNKNAFLVGSSANLHGREAAETAKQVYEAFKNAKPGLSFIVQDKKMEKAKAPFHGTHTMIQYKKGKFEIIRIGSIAAEHFTSIYPQIGLQPQHQQKELKRFKQDQEKKFHINEIRKKRSYII